MKSIGIFLILSLISTIGFAQQKTTVFDNSKFLIESAHMIKSAESEISPVFVEDSIYFSGVAEKYLNNSKREKNTTDVYNIYSAAIDQEGKISSSRKLVPGFDHDYHEGPVDYCEATGELFVTLSNINDFDKVQKMAPIENIRLELAIFKKNNGRWEMSEKLPFNDKRYHFAQPAISITGDTLIFSSDLKPANYGSTDLFMSIRKNGKWSAPVNLGSKINKAGSELFPTFLPGGLLSFASNWPINYGGLDIYYASFPQLDSREILGNDINSQFDDFGLIIHKNGNVGYFTSNRNKKSSDDIFKLEIQKQYKIFKGRVLEFETNLPIANAEVIIKSCYGGIIEKRYSDSNGNFSFEMINDDCVQLEILKDGYKNAFKNITGLDNMDFKLEFK